MLPLARFIEIPAAPAAAELPLKLLLLTASCPRSAHTPPPFCRQQQIRCQAAVRIMSHRRIFSPINVQNALVQ